MAFGHQGYSQLPSVPANMPYKAYIPDWWAPRFEQRLYVIFIKFVVCLLSEMKKWLKYLLVSIVALAFYNGAGEHLENQRLRDRKTGRGRQTAREQKPDTQKGQGTTHTKKETKKERWSSQKRKTEKKDREMRPEHGLVTHKLENNNTKGVFPLL